MNNVKCIISKGGMQVSIYISVWYYECAYYFILLHIYSIIKECSSVKSLLVLTYPHHKNTTFWDLRNLKMNNSCVGWCTFLPLSKYETQKKFKTSYIAWWSLDEE